MKICGLSDIHGTLLPLDWFEPCELVCICGDISPLNIQANDKLMRRWLLKEFKPWCESLPCDKVIFIAGNHDWICSRDPKFMFDNFEEEDKVTYICHETYTYTSSEGKKYSIFGTPFCRQFCNWAFMESDDMLETLYSSIPEDLDILITHDQPYGYGDVLLQDVYWNTGKHIGNVPLTKAVLEKQPKVMLTGHLHSTDHNCVMIENTMRYNVSLKDERYDPIYEPLIIEI